MSQSQRVEIKKQVTFVVAIAIAFERIATVVVAVGIATARAEVKVVFSGSQFEIVNWNGGANDNRNERHARCSI